VLWCADISWAQVAPQEWWSLGATAGGLALVLGYRFIYRFNQWVIASGVD